MFYTYPPKVCGVSTSMVKQYFVLTFSPLVHPSQPRAKKEELEKFI